MKIGDRVVWESWAGPQIIVNIYRHGTEIFAELKPANSASLSVGHDVYLDQLEHENQPR